HIIRGLCALGRFGRWGILVYLDHEGREFWRIAAPGLSIPLGSSQMLRYWVKHIPAIPPEGSSCVRY
ncbi:MAG: hypothetical protein WBH04_05865, partial [Albidovulum sp.]